MANYRDQRYPGRGEARGFGDRGYEEQGRHRHDFEHEHERSFGGFGRGSTRDRMGSEQFRAQDEYGGFGERDYRDFGRGQPGGVYEHAGSRGYRHGGGYGGYGESPGESGGGFGSGRSYAAEPGWGPGYGEQSGYYGARSGREYGDARGYEAQGSHPASYGTQRGGFGSRPSGPGFGEAGHSYGEQGGFSQSQYGYGAEPGQTQGGWNQRRHMRGPKGYQRSDERLKEDISERLMSAVYIDASDVSVEVKDGKVTLEGTVPERRLKHRIEDIVDDCMGVKDIDNRIRVTPGSFGESRSETTLSIGGSQGSGGSSSGGGTGFGGAGSGGPGQ